MSFDDRNAWAWRDRKGKGKGKANVQRVKGEGVIIEEEKYEGKIE